MNTHYFTDNRHLRENRKELSFRFWCFNLRFTSDNGVFSKDGIDFGTRVLLKTLREHKAELGDNLLVGLWLWGDWYHIEESIPG